MKVVTRFPPSPTGYFHIGSARTALFNYLFAAAEGGVMYLRFEDTDKARSKPEYEEDILEGLKWLGIPYTLPEPYRQSERTARYSEALKQLIAKDVAYISTEAAKDDATKQVSVVRLRNPGRSVTFSDLIRGDVTFDTTELKDFVIARSVEDALYHFTVVVDDADMEVTHVIRGEDHISNTARQILILEALGFTRPEYAHIPLILAPDRSKLSKRHGAVSVNEYRKEGYLPEALVNYLALLGWNPGGERELYTLHELTKVFSLEHVQKGGAVFDVEKLKWFNHEYLKGLPDEEFKRLLAADVQIDAHTPLPLLKERARTVGEAAALLQSGEFAFLSPTIEYEAALLLSGAKTDAEDAKKHLQKVLELMETLRDFNAEAVKAIVFPYATDVGRSKVLWPLRVALSGREKSPDPFLIASLIGKEKALHRIGAAIQKL